MHQLYNDSWLRAHHFKLSTGEQVHYWADHPARPKPQVALFLHGMKGNHAGLSGLAWEYRAQFPRTPIIIVDLPGFGVSEPFRDLSDDILLACYNQLLEELLLHLKAKHYTLVGHSFGAMVAYAYLSYAQDKRVREAYLFGTHVDGSGVNGRLLGLYRHSARVLPAGLQRRYLYNRWLNHFESMIFTKSKDPKIRELIFESRRRELGFQEPGTLLASFKTSADIDLRALPIPQHAKLLFAQGQKDNISKLAPLKELARLNRAPIILLDKVGHYLVNEDPWRSGQVFAMAQAAGEYAIIKLP